MPMQIKASSLLYNEMIHIGKDFSDMEVVRAYDEKHGKFRDIDSENEVICKNIGLRKEHIVADFGCGTGNFVIYAAQRCKLVYAVDISRIMLDYTKEKAEKLGLTNIIYCHGGFLTYIHEKKPLDAVITSIALHHLPDFWKQKALIRLNRILKPNGKLFLADVVFTDNDYEKNIEMWLNRLSSTIGEEVAKDISEHIKKEYSTFSWIMEGLIIRAGFQIDMVEYIDGVIGRYTCTKVNKKLI